MPTNRPLVRDLLSVLAAALLVSGVAAPSWSAEAKGSGPRLAHSVFFTLKDRSPEARKALAASCREHLAGIGGAVSFAVGTIAEDVVEPVSVRDFDVALLVVFEDKAASDTYQSHPSHKAFIEENRASWSQVRVFDAYLPPAD
jgi:hypothetical protein